MRACSRRFPRALEALAADIALEGLVVGVDLHVDVEATLRRQALVADGALEAHPTRGDLVVLTQGDLGGKGLVADKALVHLAAFLAAFHALRPRSRLLNK